MFLKTHSKQLSQIPYHRNGLGSLGRQAAPEAIKRRTLALAHPPSPGLRVNLDPKNHAMQMASKEILTQPG